MTRLQRAFAMFAVRADVGGGAWVLTLETAAAQHERALELATFPSRREAQLARFAIASEIVRRFGRVEQ